MATPAPIRDSTGISNSTMTYDFAIVGSGFGGSVSALRLAEKGYRSSPSLTITALAERAMSFMPEARKN
jgi:2-polyprenyl-6-methoxyphenol hydroxylase-like FAD-dependent oxidoreductase